VGSFQKGDETDARGKR